MRPRMTYLCACVVAALAGFVPPITPRATNNSDFPGWPKTFEGRALKEVPMTPRESRFYKDFDGQIGRFTDGSREIIIRYVPDRERKFHMTSRCYRAVGYEIRPLPARVDADGNRWGTFRATRGKESMEVSEQIKDSTGHVWTDESAWRWDSFWGNTTGPWWAVTIATKD
ncbi:MAG: hypothetical protein K1X53_17660 [Candidatus Sumerlaeaceae bacterium]|nr:hypothetical protein [Candidatus Sumerlaeaceae bacterium]